MPRFTLPWNRREKFSTWSVGDPAFAGWWMHSDQTLEPVTPYTILGLSAVLRSVSVISTTIAGLPLRTYERQGEERVRVPSVFDDPYPGPDGLTPFAWSETLLIHLLLWREAFLWHEDFDSDGFVSAYRPIIPSAISVKIAADGKTRQFQFTDPIAGETKTVGSDMVTYIPGPSLDGLRGHPLLWAARHIFSAALSGDKAASRTLNQGIRIGALLTPGEGEDIDPSEGESILEQLRPSLTGPNAAGNIAFINKRLKLDPWTQTNSESQWRETRLDILGEIERLFGMPPHLLADTEKQTSWGTGVAEQNLGLSRYTLRGWSDRIEQILTRQLPNGSNAPRDGSQFTEYDYKGLLQGTPAEEITLMIQQVEAGLVSLDYACRVLNLPAPTEAQRSKVASSVTPSTEAPA